MPAHPAAEDDEGAASVVGFGPSVGLVLIPDGRVGPFDGRVGPASVDGRVPRAPTVAESTATYATARRATNGVRVDSIVEAGSGKQSYARLGALQSWFALTA
jgi:hypothetical protein